jgi:hypothetical protein
LGTFKVTEDHYSVGIRIGFNADPDLAFYILWVIFAPPGSGPAFRQPKPMRIYADSLMSVLTRIADLHHFNADPDPPFYVNADPDPPFYFNADSDPAFLFHADPDPAFIPTGLKGSI